MRGANNRLFFALTVLAAAFFQSPQPARAEIVDYYYIGAPYRIANFRHPTPSFTTGHLTIDTSKLPEGKTLENLVVTTLDLGDDDRGPWPSFLKFAFGNRSRTLFHEGLPPDLSSFRFDADRNLTSWHVEGWYDDGPYRLFAGVSGDWSREYYGGLFQYTFPDPPDFSIPECRGEWGNESWECVAAHRDRFLEKRGYRVGSPAYLAIIKQYGSAMSTVAESVEGMLGHWFTDPLAYAAKVEEYALYAAKHPPLNIHDIAPIPLPATGWLVGLGLAALAGARSLRARPGRPNLTEA